MNKVLGVLSYVGMALVIGAVAVRFGALSFLGAESDRYAGYAAWAGLALVLAYAIGQWREIAAYFSKRSARYGTLAWVGIVAVLGILSALNWLSNRRNVRWDLTENQQYTLSDQTTKILQELTAPVTFYVFDREQEFDRFRSRMDAYQYNSRQLRVEYIDPDRNPGPARQYNVETYGTVVLEYMDRTERVTSDAEQDLTNALIKVITGAQKKVYFLQGHGEKDTSDSGRAGYSSVADALKRDNYAFENLVLAQQPEIPTDASVIVIAGPRTDLLAPEVELLEKYLAGGGHLFVLLDPPETEDGPMPALEGMLSAWAITAGNNVVVDVSGMGQLLGTDASVPVAATYPAHAITERFNLLTAYPIARSIEADTASTSGRVAQSIVQTSARSWAETDVREFQSGGKVEMNEGADKPGPVSIGVAVTAPVAEEPKPADEETGSEQEDELEPASRPESRIAVIGDSDFAANSALGIQGNRDLFMNAVSWLAQQESLIAIRPREAADRRLTLTARANEMFMWLSIFIIPGLVLGTGVYTWWRRR